MMHDCLDRSYAFMQPHHPHDHCSDLKMYPFYYKKVLNIKRRLSFASVRWSSIRWWRSDDDRWRSSGVPVHNSEDIEQFERTSGNPT